MSKAKKPTQEENWATPESLLGSVNKRPFGLRHATEVESEEHWARLAAAGDATAMRRLERLNKANNGL